MGEARRKRQLAEKLGETRGDGFEAFSAEIAALRAEGGRADQLDRLRFHELFTTALVEGLRERAGDAPTWRREVEVMQAACMAAGACLSATFLGRVKNTDEAQTAMANAVIQAFAEGVMIGANPSNPVEASDE